MKYSIFENTVRNLLTTSSYDFTLEPTKFQNIDFIGKDENNKLYGIELQSNNITNTDLEIKINNIKNNENKIDKLVMVSPDTPIESQINFLKSITSDKPFESYWVDINNLPSILGINETIDLKEPKMISLLQTAAITKNIDRYADIKNLSNNKQKNLFSKPISFINWIDDIEKNKDKIPKEYNLLGRQFSHRCISKILKEGREFDEILYLGNKKPYSIIVLSDLMNFSKLVGYSSPEFLKEKMYNYYKNARELVWHYGGTLDKFIGDAVLAIFNYPFDDKNSSIDVINFSRDLINLGKNMLTEMINSIDERIETGTRIGISKGDLWILDIGKDTTEVSFIGNVINKTARLEKACEKNGILISNILKNDIERIDINYLKQFKIEERILTEEESKGQKAEITVWQLIDK